MGLMDKVEEIRKQPEHIRMRYVWFFVALSMFFVIILWIFSLTTAKPEAQSSPAENTFFNSGIINDFSQQQRTLDEARKNAEKSLSNNNALNSGTQTDGPQDNQIQKSLNNENGQ